MNNIDNDDYGPGDNYWDWADDIDLGVEDANLLNQLDTFRRSEPVLWALFHGLSSSRSIAGWILWPHHTVLWKLREYKKQGWVIDTEGKVQVHWTFTENESTEEYRSLRKWIRAQRLKGGIFNPEDSQPGD